MKCFSCKKVLKSGYIYNNYTKKYYCNECGYKAMSCGGVL